MTDGRTWLTVDEAAQLLSMSSGHLSKLVENDRPAYDCCYVAPPRPVSRRERRAQRPTGRFPSGGVR